MMKINELFIVTVSLLFSINMFACGRVKSMPIDKPPENDPPNIIEYGDRCYILDKYRWIVSSCGITKDLSYGVEGQGNMDKVIEYSEYGFGSSSWRSEVGKLEKVEQKKTNVSQRYDKKK